MAADGSGPRALLDRYELREQVGAGGMGEVWLGWDRRLQRDVAVKRLLPQLSEEPAFRQRFEVEARAAAALDHPNVVPVYDIDQDGRTLFIVMERLPGPSLDRRLADGPLSEDEVRRLAADMLSGLAAAHAENLLHRDIKPGNLIRTAGDRWKIGDFGVAKDLASAAQLTLVGVAVGTPAYLAPEQLEGRPATVATDLWAAAVVLRETLTGRRPFEGADPISVAHAVRHTRLEPLVTLRPDVATDLAAAVDRGLLLDPGLRFSSAEEMLAAIEGRGVTPAPVPPPAVAPPAAPAPSPAAPAAGPPGRRRSPLVPLLWAVTAVGASILVALIVALVVGVVLTSDGGDDEPPPTSAPTTTAPVDPAPTAEDDPGTGRPGTTEEEADEDDDLDQGDAPGEEAPGGTEGGGIGGELGADSADPDRIGPGGRPGP